VKEYEKNHDPFRGGSYLSVAHQWGNEFASKHKIQCRYHKEAMLFYILHENNLGN
jgi:hypothetical protein